MRALHFLVAGVCIAGPAAAASMAVTKSSALVSDPVNTINPRAIPGAVVDYALLVTNPVGNALTPVRAVVITDPIPATLKLRIADYAAGTGPVQFTDGGLLGLGLLNGGLTYSYGGLSSTTDGLEFSDGMSWAYTPQDDGTGYDPKVRGVRVTMGGTQTAGGSFRLRYRVQVR